MKKSFMLVLPFLVCGQMEAMSKLFGKKKVNIYENDKYTFKPIYSIEESTNMLQEIVESCAFLAELRAVNSSGLYGQRELASSAEQAWQFSQDLLRVIAQYQNAKHQSQFYWQEETLLESLKEQHFSQRNQVLKAAQEEILNNYFNSTLAFNNQLREKFKKFKPEENQ